MTVLAIICLFVLISCMGVCLYRIVVAPNALQRLLAFDLAGALISLTFALFALIRDNWVYLEISMGLAVLALVATIAIAHFIERERIF